MSATAKHPADGHVPLEALKMMAQQDEEPAKENDDYRPKNACARFNRCGNRIPGNGELCSDCLDEVRGVTDGHPQAH